MDKMTLTSDRAGDHWFFKMSKQMPPEALIWMYEKQWNREHRER